VQWYCIEKNLEKCDKNMIYIFVAIISGVYMILWIYLLTSNSGNKFTIKNTYIRLFLSLWYISLKIQRYYKYFIMEKMREREREKKKKKNSSCCFLFYLQMKLSLKWAEYLTFRLMTSLLALVKNYCTSTHFHNLTL